MRKIEINYQNTTSLVNDLITVTSELENEKESVKRALDELNDLENYHANKGDIVNELEFRKRKIDKDIQNTEELIQNIKDFSERVQETDERLAQKFKQDIKSYAKLNSIELVSDFDKWLDKAQMALDGLGLIPVVGEVADVINGVIYLAKGDIKNAGISFISMIPEVGDTAKSVRYFDKASDLLKLGDKVVDLEKSSKKISKATKNLDIKDIDFKIDSKKYTPKSKSDKKIKSNYSEIFQTGGRELSIEEYLKQEEYAEKMYDKFRKSNTDIKNISENTNIPEWRVKRIKEHVFYNEHIKDFEVGRFDPDYDMAKSWERLINGNYVKSDLDLLNHEIFEAKFEAIFKTNYRTAHEKTIKSGRNWIPEGE